MANRGEARAKLGRWRAISRTACSLFLAGFAVSSLSCGSDKGSSATPSSVPTAGAGTSLIAFETDRDGNDEIYIMDPNGSRPKRLTNNPASDQNPAWGSVDTLVRVS